MRTSLTKISIICVSSIKLGFIPRVCQRSCSPVKTFLMIQSVFVEPLSAKTLIISCKFNLNTAAKVQNILEKVLTIPRKSVNSQEFILKTQCLYAQITFVSPYIHGISGQYFSFPQDYSYTYCVTLF